MIQRRGSDHDPCPAAADDPARVAQAQGRLAEQGHFTDRVHKGDRTVGRGARRRRRPKIEVFDFEPSTCTLRDCAASSISYGIPEKDLQIAIVDRDHFVVRERGGPAGAGGRRSPGRPIRIICTETTPLRIEDETSLGMAVPQLRRRGRWPRRGSPSETGPTPTKLDVQAAGWTVIGKGHVFIISSERELIREQIFWERGRQTATSPDCSLIFAVLFCRTLRRALASRVAVNPSEPRMSMSGPGRIQPIRKCPGWLRRRGGRDVGIVAQNFGEQDLR